MSMRPNSRSAVSMIADAPGSGSRLRFRIGGLDDLAVDGWIDACSSAVALYAVAARD